MATEVLHAAWRRFQLGEVQQCIDDCLATLERQNLCDTDKADAHLILACAGAQYPHHAAQAIHLYSCHACRGGYGSKAHRCPERRLLDEARALLQGGRVDFGSISEQLDARLQKHLGDESRRLQDQLAGSTDANFCDGRQDKYRKWTADYYDALISTSGPAAEADPQSAVAAADKGKDGVYKYDGTGSDDAGSAAESNQTMSQYDLAKLDEKLQQSSRERSEDKPFRQWHIPTNSPRARLLERRHTSEQVLRTSPSMGSPPLKHRLSAEGALSTSQPHSPVGSPRVLGARPDHP